MDWLVGFVSGEKPFLEWWGKPNGGTVVFLRSLWVTVFVYFLALGLRSFNAKWPWCFDKSQYFRDLPETLPWVGATFAFAYLALYSRFASQSTYLAGVYNQIMATRAQIRGMAPTEAQRDLDSNVTLAGWSAGFIEDALEMHLATKKLFSVTVWLMLKDPKIYNQFVQSTVDGRKRAQELRRALKKAIPEPELKFLDESDALAWNVLDRLIGAEPRP